jgi:hypothetical protein
VRAAAKPTRLAQRAFRARKSPAEAGLQGLLRVSRGILDRFNLARRDMVPEASFFGCDPGHPPRARPHCGNQMDHTAKRYDTKKGQRN